MSDSKTPFLIVGAGPEGRIALDILTLLDVVIYGFITDQEELLLKEVNNVLVAARLGTPDCQTLLQDEHIKLVLAARDPETRMELVEQVGDVNAQLVNAIHPLHSIGMEGKQGRGNLIQAGVTIGPNVLLGSFNFIEPQVAIGADVAIGDYCNLQMGVRIGRGAQIHDEVNIGMGAIIHPEVHLGEGVMVGPGSVVIQDVEDGQTVFGNPAKVV